MSPLQLSSSSLLGTDFAQYERKGTPQTSPSSCVAIATSDSEPEDSAEPCPKYEALSPRAFKKSPDIDPLSPSEELDCSEDEFFVYPGQYSDKIRHIEDRDKALLFGEITSYISCPCPLIKCSRRKGTSMILCGLGEWNFGTRPRYPSSLSVSFRIHRLPGFLVVRSHAQVPTCTV